MIPDIEEIKNFILTESEKMTNLLLDHMSKINFGQMLKKQSIITLVTIVCSDLLKSIYLASSKLHGEQQAVEEIAMIFDQIKEYVLSDEDK